MDIKKVRASTWILGYRQTPSLPTSEPTPMRCEHSLLLLVMVLYEIGDFEKSNNKQTLLSYVLLFITVCFLKNVF